MQQLRSVIKYPGSKWRIADWIINHMAEHRSYLEPFLGSGGVFFRKPPSRIETINDIDGDIMNLFQCIREDTEKLAMMIETTPYCRKEYETAFAESPIEPFERARLYLIKTWMDQGFRTFSGSGWKNDVAGREYAYDVRCWNQLPKWIAQACFRLKDAQIECRPALEVIQSFNHPDVLIYADPPYLPSTRRMKKQYTHEMSDNDHIELLKALKQHQGPVLLSGYDNDLYNDMLQGWQKDQIATTAGKGKRRLGTLWIKPILCDNISFFDNQP